MMMNKKNENDEKALLIAEIMNIQYNDPVADKLDLDDGTKKIVDYIIGKLPQKLDDVGVEDLKIIKKLNELQVESRNLIAENIEIVKVVTVVMNEIIEEIGEDEEFIKELDI